VRTTPSPAARRRTAATGGAVRRTFLAVVAAVSCAACGSGGSCETTTSAAPSCPDLTFEHRSYVEWREIHPHEVLQEVGDASYPACTKARVCGGDPLDGKGATDVWQYADVDAEEAVVGLRQDTHTYVVFVRSGVDPTTLPRRP
jgi:hypothetical protein